ncbi:hypothetical protein RIF29_31512 [Crotalaria pallida]|uniref:Protein artemis n=1 Tax=Crotalaria pallida TaxID=3830 RepID=A0AAN9EPD9_CROPI
MENGLISVDRWAKGSSAYFLTHLHSDHTIGLSSSWSYAPLFCSRLTAKLLPFKFPDFDLSLVRILDTGSWHTLSPSPAFPATLHVFAIDACHCPGSIMLVFRGEFGCRLYTGDFRWEPSCEKARKAREMLVDVVKDDVVDVVYLDNTYSNPIYDFPSRQLAANRIIDIISSHPDHDIIIGINTLGKEDLLLQIARALKIKIWVWPERLQTMHLLGFHDIFTTNTTLTRVRAVPQYSFSIDTLEALNTMRPTIGIMPSALPWVKKSLQKGELLSGSFLTSRFKRGRMSENGVQIDKQIGNTGPLDKFHEYIYSVPYSDHSNFAEIEDFIRLVHPATLKGIVSSSSCYIEPMYYFGRLCRVNQPIRRQLHNMHKRVEAVSPKISFGGDNVKSERNKGKNLKGKFLGVRVSKLSIYRRRQRGVKIVEDNSLDQD